MGPILSGIRGPADVKALPADKLPALAAEIRAEIIGTVGAVVALIVIGKRGK